MVRQGEKDKRGEVDTAGAKQGGVEKRCLLERPNHMELIGAETDYDVAIKIINTATVKEEYVLKNLEREARILSSVSHPCIVYIYETIQYRNLYCIVTELLPGKDLYDFMKEQVGGRLNERTARRFVRQLASALEHMHARGIVHRDLKMQNVVVDIRQNLVKIIDFGLSNFWSLEEPLSTHCGSPEYAAPELFITGRKYGPEVDLWSLGVIIFCMSAGSLPFSLDEKEQSLSFDHQRRLLVSRIRKGILQRHRNLISHFSKDFSGLIIGLLKTNPKQRFRVEQVLCHSWTTKSRSFLLDIPETFEPGRKFERQIILQLCVLLDTVPREVEKKLMREPLGSVGGMLRILNHSELKKHWHAIEPFSPPNTPSNSRSLASLGAGAVKKKPATLNVPKTIPDGALDVNSKNINPTKDTSGNQDASMLDDQYQSLVSFRHEPWSGNFSSIITNDQISLVIVPLRSRDNVYNYKKYSPTGLDEESVSPGTCRLSEGAGLSVNGRTTSTESTLFTSVRSENTPKSLGKNHGHGGRLNPGN